MIIGSSIKDFGANLRLQRSYNWEILLPDVVGLRGTDVSKFCQSVSFGQYNVDEIDHLRYGPFRTKYAGKLEIVELKLMFIVPIPDIVSEYFLRWRELVIDKAGLYSPKVKYVKDAHVVLYDVDGKEVSKFRFIGVFPKELPEFDLSYESEEILKYRVALSVDKVTKLL